MLTKVLRLFVVVAALATVALGPTVPSSAQRVVQIVTPYPAVNTQSGKTVTLNLDVLTPSRLRVDMATTEVPPGWKATLRGGGFVVSAVFGSPKTQNETPPQVQLEIQVPADAQPGTYRVTVRGSGGGATDVLPVDVTVSEQASGAVTLTAEFPSQRAAATDTFTFNVILTNNTPEKTSFNLSTEAPEGWEVTAQPSTESRATTVSVDGGETATISVSANPPDQIPAGTYPLKVKAAGAGNNAEAELTAEITGSFTVELTTPTERLSTDAVAGKRTDLTLEIRNTGASALSNVTLSETAPEGWKVTFEPKSIESIEAGKTAKATARVTPSAESVAGDYVLNLTAAAGSATDSAEFRVTVSTSRLTGLFAILLIAAVVGAVLWVFRRYGRR